MASGDYDVPELRPLASTAFPVKQTALPLSSDYDVAGLRHQPDNTSATATDSSDYDDPRQFDGAAWHFDEPGESGTDDNGMVANPVFVGDRKRHAEGTDITLIAEPRWSNRRKLLLAGSLVLLLALCIALPLATTAASPGSSRATQSSCNATDSGCPCPEGLYKVASSPCTAWRLCQQGELLATTGSSTSDRICQACPASMYQNASNHTAPSCYPHKLCTNSEYMVTDGSVSADRVCQACAAGLYRASPVQCQAWRLCQQGERVIAAGSSTSDRICQACPSSMYQDASSHSATACKPYKLCGAGERMTAEGTPTLDRVCEPCRAGSYQSATIHNADVCIDWQLCNAGQYVKAAGTLTSNRVCKPCPASTFQDTILHLNNACLPKSPCGGGHYAVEGNSSVDRTCLPCPTGMPCCLHREVQSVRNPCAAYL